MPPSPSPPPPHEPMIPPAPPTDVETPADDRFAPGEEIVPGVFAWALIGDGRRCESWLAWSTELWSPVVIKLPLASQLDNPRTARRLAEEAAMLDRLRHPAVNRLLADRHRHRVPHLLLEYVEGPNLADVLEDNGPLAPADAIRLGMQIGCGLHHIHSRGVVHLDIKPANVILCEGRAVILDFDIARPIGAPVGPGQSQGTVGYMAPEQCRKLPFSPSMDVFALGALLYEAVTGARAFPAGPTGDDSSPELVLRPRRPRRLRPEVPPALDEAIAGMLSRSLRRRPRSAVEVLRVLGAALPAGEEALWPEWAGALLDRRTAGARPTKVA
jgi:eukaryotic-like serine/threonine-protein kinase